MSTDKTPTNPLLDDAMEQLSKCIRENDTQKTHEAWNALGLVHLHAQRNPEEAIRCHKEALTLLEADVSGSTRVYLKKATTLQDLGLCYERLHNQKRALELYQEARDLLTEHCSLETSHPRMLSIELAINRLLRML